jgi:hypothetical protein
MRTLIQSGSAYLELTDAMVPLAALAILGAQLGQVLLVYTHISQDGHAAE